MPSIYLSGQLQSLTLFRYTLLTDYLNPGDNSQKTALDKQIDRANSQTDDVINRYNSLIDSPTDRQLFQTLISTRAPYDECFNRVRSLSRQGLVQDAQNLTRTQLVPLRNAFLKAAEAEVSWNKADADDSVHEISKAVNWTSTGILICLVFGVGVVCSITVIRALLQIETKLRESEHRFREVFEQAADGIVITDVHGKIQFTNTAFTAMTGYACEEVVGRNPRIFKSGRNSEAVYKELWTTILSGRVWHGEVINRRKDGSLYDEEMRIAPLKDSKGATTGFVAIKQDVTAKRVAQEAQAFLAAIVESSQDAIMATTQECLIRAWNRGAEAEFGYSAEEVIGKHVSMLMAPERMGELAEFIGPQLKGITVAPFESVCVRKNGSRMHVSVTGSPIKNSAGEVVAMSAVLRDITERRESEQRLRESEERFRTMADSSPSLMWVTGPAGEVDFINRQYRRFCGVTAKHAQQGDWRSLIHPDDRAEYMAAFHRAVTEHTTFRTEVRIRRADGEWRLIGTNAEPQLSPAGEYMGHIGLSADITERKQAEQALEFQHSLIRAIQEVSPDGILVVNEQGVVVTHNRKFLEVWQFPDSFDLDLLAENAAGVPHRSALSACASFASDPEALIKRVQDLTENPRGSERFEIPLKDGRILDRYSTGLWSESDQYLGRVWFFRDITERKQAEDILRHSEQKFRQLAENIHEVFRIMPIALDETLYVSPAYEEIWGRSMESLYRNPESWRDAVHPDDREQADYMAAHQLLGDPVEVEYRIQTPDGRQKWIRDRAFPVRDQSGALIRIAGIAEDISERKRAEQAILASHEFVQSTIDALSSSMCVLDETGTIIEVNRTWKDFAVANRNCRICEHSDFSQLENQFGSGANYLDACDRAVANGAAEAAEFAAGIRSLLRGDMEEFTKEYACHAPRERRWFVAKGTRFFDHGLPRVVVEHVNITTRKVAEEAMRMAKLEAEAEGVRANLLAREAERATAAKSEFLANMSHEIRTPMNGVIGMTGLLLDTELTAEQRRYADLARISGESLLQLINDILDFSKIEAKKLELETIDFDLRSLLDNLASIFSATAQTRGIEFKCIADPAVPTNLRGDPGRLRQILTNLSGNGIKFTEKGEVVVRVAIVEAGESDCVLRFSVHDTGIGIGDDKIGVLFEKFSQVEASTTRKYGGTGLGLAISKQLVEMMGGAIGVTSRPGEGSEFWFTARLRWALGLGGYADTQLEGHTKARLHGRVLVAEDNSTNREVALGILRKLGLRADAVVNGEEAVSALASIPYDLVLMDMRMPVMDGIEASRRIRNPDSAVLNHDIPIIALTANAMQSDRVNCISAGMNDFVPKPILKGALRDALEKWLPMCDSATPQAESACKPANTSDGGTEVFDPASVLSRLEGDKELVQLVFETFLADIPQQIEGLKELVETGDHGGAARQAHSIRGASSSVGGESLRKLATEMEKAADAGDWHIVVTLMDELELQYGLLRNAMEGSLSVHTKGS